MIQLCWPWGGIHTSYTVELLEHWCISPKNMKTFLFLHIMQFLVKGIPQSSHVQRMTTKQKMEMCHAISSAPAHSRSDRDLSVSDTAQCQCLGRKVQCRQPNQGWGHRLALWHHSVGWTGMSDPLGNEGSCTFCAQVCLVHAPVLFCCSAVIAPAIRCSKKQWGLKYQYNTISVL